MSGLTVATIVNVAKAAGVSTATVSRFLRGDAVRSADAIRRSIEALRYRPAFAARALRSGVHYAVAMVVPDITNPYFASLAKGAESVFRSTPYRVFLCNTDERTELEDAVLDEIVRRVDGIILAPAQEHEQTPATVRRQGVPIVLVDRDLDDKTFDCVLVDNAGGAAAAARHLQELGHTRIAIISGPLTNTPGRTRFDGFTNELARAGLPVPDAFLRIADFKEAGGREAMRGLMALPRPPTAVFCANNAMTIGALKALAERDIAVGVDVSLIGFDDIDLGSLLKPPLTVVDRSSEEQGAVAARLLLRRLADGPDGAAERIVLPTRLVVRGSCSAPPTDGPIRPKNRERAGERVR